VEWDASLALLGGASLIHGARLTAGKVLVPIRIETDAMSEESSEFRP